MFELFFPGLEKIVISIKRINKLHQRAIIISGIHFFQYETSISIDKAGSFYLFSIIIQY